MVNGAREILFTPLCVRTYVTNAEQKIDNWCIQITDMTLKCLMIFFPSHSLYRIYTVQPSELVNKK